MRNVMSPLLLKKQKRERYAMYIFSQLNDNDFSFQETMSYLLSKLI